MSNTRIPAFAIFLLICLILSSSIGAQFRDHDQAYKYPAQLLTDLKRLQEAALASDYALKQAAHLCNNIGPRLSGSPQAQRAVDYVAAELRKLGLEVKYENQANAIANHVAAIESDLGAGHPAGIYAHVAPAALPMLQPAANLLQNSGAGVIKVVTDSVGSDISPLERAGLPGIAPLQDERTYFNYHHTAADTFDKIKPRELAENAAVMAVMAYAIANLPDLLPKQSGQ